MHTAPTPHPAWPVLRPVPRSEGRRPWLSLQAVGFGDTGVSFDAQPGEVVHLRGGSPVVRLRVLALLAGCAPASSGRCFLLGRDLALLDDTQRATLRQRHITHVMVADTLRGTATVLDSVAAPLLQQGWPAHEARDRAALELDALGAAALAARPVAALSLPEMRLALLARATAPQPRLLVLENPEAWLGPTALAAVRLSLWALSSAFETCVVMTTTHPRLAATADRCVDLDRAALRVVPS